MNKRKVGVYLDFPPQGGGTFQYGLFLLEALSLLQDEVSVEVLLRDQEWIPHVERFQFQFQRLPRERQLWKLIWKFWKFFQLPIQLWRNFLSPFHPLHKILNQDPTRVWIFPSQDVVPAKFKIRGLVAVHDLMHIYESEFPEVGTWREKRRRNWDYAQICKFSEKILVDSQVGRRQVIESFSCPPEKVAVLPYTVPYYIRKIGAQISPRPIKEKYFFYPAQFWLHKNHGRLIEAFQQISDRHPDIHLVLTGAPHNSYHQVQDLIAKLRLQDKVHILGYVNDDQVVSLYTHSLALVFPTFFGPTNIPPLEALYLGRPVICSDIYAAREVLGDRAVYVDPQSVDSIARAMEQVIVSPPQRGPFPQELGIEAFTQRLKAILIESPRAD